MLAVFVVEVVVASPIMLLIENLHFLILLLLLKSEGEEIALEFIGLSLMLKRRLKLSQTNLQCSIW